MISSPDHATFSQSVVQNLKADVTYHTPHRHPKAPRILNEIFHSAKARARTISTVQSDQVAPV